MNNVLTHIAGVPVTELGAAYGTPAFVYDQATIEQRIAEVQQFPVVRFAQKACSNIAILALMRRHGVVVDAVSAGEILRALRAGYTAEGSPPGIVYTADVFDDDAIALIAEHRIPVNVGSPEMITQLGAFYPGADVTLRINPGFGHGHSRKTNTGGELSKHGIWYSRAAGVPAPRQGGGRQHPRAAHAHRLGDGLRAPGDGVRRDGEGGLGDGAATGSDQRGWRVAHPIPPRTAADRRRRVLRALGPRPPHDRGHRRARRHPGGRAGAISRGRGRVPGHAHQGRQADGREHVLPGRRGLRHARPPGDVRLVPRDLDRARRRPRDHGGARRNRRRAAVRIGRRVHAGRGRRGGHAAAAGGAHGRLPRDPRRGGVRRNDVVELQHAAAGGRSADHRRPPGDHPRAPDVRAHPRSSSGSRSGCARKRSPRASR